MARKKTPNLSPLSPFARGALENLLEAFRQLLLVEASRLAAGQAEIQEAHIRGAYRNLIDPESRADVQSIISRAIRENKAIEWLAYVMIAGLFSLGGGFIGIGLFGSAESAARLPQLVGGSVVAVLLLPALRFAINARRHNIAIRLFGVVIERVRTPKALAALLEQLTQFVTRR